MNKTDRPANNTNTILPSQDRQQPNPTRRNPSTPPTSSGSRATVPCSTVSLGTSASVNSSSIGQSNSFSSPDRKQQHSRDFSNPNLATDSFWNSPLPQTPKHSRLLSFDQAAVEDEALSLLSFSQSPVKKPQYSPSKRKEKNVSFGLLEHPVTVSALGDEHQLPPFSPLKLRKIPEWDTEDNGDSDSSIIKVPQSTEAAQIKIQPKRVPAPIQSKYRAFPYPTPPPTLHRFRHLRKRPYIYPSYTMQDSRRQQSHANADDPKPSSSSAGHVITAGSNGVEVVYEQQEKAKKNDTPPREKNLESDKKVNVISPPEGQNYGHARSPSYNAADYGELPGVPDSPYLSPYHHGYPNWPPPTNSPSRSQKTPKRSNDEGQYPPYSPHYSGYHHFAPPGYDDGYRKMSSPGKRQRVGASDEHSSKDREAADHFLTEPVDRYHYTESYPKSAAFYPPDFYSESFDSVDHPSRRNEGKYVGVPPVTKASSYPPPSPHDEGAADSSASSYPGARRPYPPSSEYSGYSHAPPYHPRLVQHLPTGGHPYDYYEGIYYQDARPHARYPPQPGAPRPTYPGYYYPEGQPPRDDVHPLLRDHDVARDRRIAPPAVAEEKSKRFSPDRSTAKTDGESVATTPSLKSRSSKSSSPNKRKPSTAAKAAIAAGMTQPPSASEVDFDIHNPPMDPVTPPSKEPVCTVTSNVTNNDVLCGRGGGTNTQIGNRRFRALVQEFQPTYLLCRRKEKPLIARTIVLIIRNRGGRFLKKDEGNGMLFEVGDEKAEAKTSQALREGLDVRASKSTTLLGRKKQREKKKVQQQLQQQEVSSKIEVSQQGDVTMAESPSRPQRDGPPPQHEYPPHYAPPHYYYGYAPQYPPYHYGYEPNPAYVSPSRKRQRAAEVESMYYPPPSYHKGVYPAYPHHPHEYQYENYPSAASQSHGGEENPMWEMEFNPPRGPMKKEMKGEE